MAYGNFYVRVKRGLTPEGELRVDAILGVDGATERYSEHRKNAAATAGFEVG